MKVCHLTTAHTWNDPRIFYKQCSSIRDKGIQVVFLAPNAPNKIIDGIEIKGVTWNRNSRLTRFFKVRNQLYKMAVSLNPDILHFHDPDFLPYALKLKKKGIKVVYDIHENYPEVILYKDWIPKIARSIVSRVFYRYEIYIAKKIDAVIPVTNYIENRFKKHHVKTQIIRNYPKTTDFSKPLHKQPNKTLKICYTGTISEETCIKELVDSLSDIDNIELNLIGWNTPKGYFDEIKKSKGWNKVIWRQNANRKIVLETILSSDIGVALYKDYSGLGYTISTKLLEYMSAGIPCITSNFGGMKKLVIDHECGITVNQLNVHAIKEGIQRLIENPKEREMMGKRGKEVALKKYSWENEAEKLFQLYLDLLENENNIS